MTRILADIPDDDIQWLDRVAGEHGCSRAAVLRDAVSAYKSQVASPGDRDWIRRGRGYWKDRADLADGLGYQAAVRADRVG